MIQERILELVKYGLTTGLIDPADEVYTVNRLLEVLGVDDIEDETFEKVAAQPAWTQEEAESKLEDIPCTCTKRRQSKIQRPLRE